MSEQEEVVVLSRTDAIKNMTDPQGREWKIKFNRGTSLLSAAPEPYRENFQVPKELVGRFTSTKVLSEKIELYLNRAWDVADVATQKTMRAGLAAKEQTAAEKKSEAAIKKAVAAENKAIKDKVKDK